MTFAPIVSSFSTTAVWPCDGRFQIQGLGSTTAVWPFDGRFQIQGLGSRVEVLGYKGASHLEGAELHRVRDLGSRVQGSRVKTWVQATWRALSSNGFCLGLQKTWMSPPLSVTSSSKSWTRPSCRSEGFSSRVEGRGLGIQEYEGL